jgi:hypothetical protein
VELSIADHAGMFYDSFLAGKASFATGLGIWNGNDRDGFVNHLVVWPFWSVPGQEIPEFDLLFNPRRSSVKADQTFAHDALFDSVPFGSI